jgi:hypothetical protein
VPDERTHLDDIALYVCTYDPNEVNRCIVQKNKTMIQTIYPETRQIYLHHGKWHSYLILFKIWQDASFYILHTPCQRGKASFKKFIIHILGRTLPCNKLPVEFCSSQDLSRKIMLCMSSARREHRTYIFFNALTFMIQDWQ